MALAASSTQLGCGRDIDHVWNHLDQAPDAHERACRYCQTARADLTGLAAATSAMRDDDATDPDLEPSPGLLERILAVARAEVRRGRRLPLDHPGPDQISLNTVSEQAVTAVVWRVGDRTPDVQIRRCTLTDTRADMQQQELSAADGLLGGPGAVTVSLRVSIKHDLSIVEATARLRADVTAAVEQEVGMQVVAVDITVEDLHDA